MKLFRRLVKWLVVLLALVAGLTALGYYGDHWLLTVDRPVGSADVIVVLGGETPNRAARAAELYQQGVARHVLVSGAGDADLIRRRLVALGVPRSAIVLEEDSISTWENAMLSARMLRTSHAHRIALVTSWYHTRRAAGTFQRVMPEVEVCPAAAKQDWETHTRKHAQEFNCVFREYGKLAGYLLLHGVVPWVK